MATTVFSGTKYRAGVLCAGLLFASLAISGPAAAQMPAEGSDSGTYGAPIGAPDATWSYSIGLGAAAVPDYEGSDDYRAAPLPIFRAQKGTQYGALFGSRASSNLLPSDNWRLGPIAEFIPKRGNNVDDRKIDHMRTVDAALMAGLQAGYEYPFGASVLGANVGWTHDVTGSNDGWLLRPGINYRRQLSDRWRLSFGTDMTYASDDYMETYFDVSQNESNRTGLKHYNADAGWKDVGANVTVSYNFNENWAMGGIAGYKRLLGDAADSPVTDDRGSANQFMGGLFFTYSWRTGS